MSKLRLNKTVFKEIMLALQKQYGDKADNVYNQIEERYNEFFSYAQIPVGKHELKYLKKAILPTIATFEITKDIDFLDCFLQIRYTKISKTYQIYGKLPFFFCILRIMTKSIMTKSDEYDAEWVKDNKNEIKFNITRCYYNDTFAKYGYPNLCLLYCRNDEIVYGPMSKNVEFIRKGMLAKGNNCCDMCLKQI